MALVVVLVALVVVGVVASIAVTALPSTTSVTLPTSGTGGGTTTTSHSMPPAALVAECVADIQAVVATAHAKGGPYLRPWSHAAGKFTLRWSGTAVVVLPAHVLADKSSAGTASQPTGCYAA